MLLVSIIVEIIMVVMMMVMIDGGVDVNIWDVRINLKYLYFFRSDFLEIFYI